MGYRDYLRRHKWYAQRLLSKEQMQEDYERLQRLQKLMIDVGMGVSIQELEENQGYWYSEGELSHRFTAEKLKSLEAIRDGDLEELVRLHEEGHAMYGYKQINIRLAVKYGRLNIIEYLVGNQWINRDLNVIVGQLASPETFKALEYLTRRHLENERTLRGWYCNLAVLDKYNILAHTFKHRYEHNGEFYGNDNYRLRNALGLNPFP